MLFRRRVAFCVERRNDDRFERLDFASAKGAAGDRVLLLPALEARLANEVSARLQFSVLVVLRADFAHLKRGAHVAVHVILLFGNGDALRCCHCQLAHDIYMHFATIWIQIPVQINNNKSIKSTSKKSDE